MSTDPKSQSEGVVANHGANANDPKRTDTGYKKTPWCIYFDYLKPLSDNELMVRRYNFENPGSEILYDDVPYLLTKLTLNARRPENEQFPWPEPQDDRKRLFRRKGYFAIVIDHQDYWFIENQGLVFSESESPNYTFYDGQVERIRVGSEFISAFYCINHMKKDRNGNDASSSPMSYRYTPNTNRPLPRSAFYPDSGGTNMGPPIGPP